MSLTSLSQQLKNRYFAFRHGKSLANQQQVIISSPVHGIDTFGLSKEGKMQVAHTIKYATEKFAFDSSVILYASDFLRTKETAEIIQQYLQIKKCFLTVKLRERFFGGWENTHASVYESVWKLDGENPNNTLNGVESTEAVRSRAVSLILELEQSFHDRNIILISHGDVLQILETEFLSLPSSHHRRLPTLDTAEIRELRHISQAL